MAGGHVIHWTSSLTYADILEIRRLFGAGWAAGAIAVRYGVSKRTIYRHAIHEMHPMEAGMTGLLEDWTRRHAIDVGPDAMAELVVAATHLATRKRSGGRRPVPPTWRPGRPGHDRKELPHLPPVQRVVMTQAPTIVRRLVASAPA